MVTARVPGNQRTVGAVVAVLAALTMTYAGRSGAAEGLSAKLFVGYQGWFGCPGDFEQNKLWQHWFVKGVDPKNLTVDLLPSVRKLDPKNLCDTGLPRADGNGTIRLFSSQDPVVVNTHFQWMRESGIDGAAAQRFVAALADPARKRRLDHVLANVRAAAESNGRQFFVVYDISGAKPETVVDDVRRDWHELVTDQKLTSSSAYLRDHGKPVLELWGIGFKSRPGEAAAVAALVSDLKSGRDGLASTYVIGGVPSHWRTLQGDSRTEPEWAKIYRSLDVISPWSVGRFSDEASTAAFMHDVVVPDLAETRRLGIGYLPVIFPGFSWYNLMTNRDNAASAVLNQVPRQCGRFLWGQAAGLLSLHVDMLYAAMFDEADEGTGLFPVETREDKLPAGSHMVYLNQDGCALPDDWYLRVAGRAAQSLHRKEVPSRNLKDVLTP